MLRASQVAGAAIPLLVASSTLAHAEAIWDGEFIARVVSAECAGTWQPGEFAAAVFRPAGLDNNGVNSHLSILQRDRSYALKVTDGAFVGNGDYTAAHTQRTARSKTYTGTFSSFSVSPANFTASTKTLHVAGILAKVDGITGCTVNFRLALVKRP